jgi:hypothetical protein
VGYWLSAVPFLPLLGREFAKAACAVVVPFFARRKVNEQDPGEDRVSVDRITQLLAFAQSRDLGDGLGELIGRGSMFSSAVASAVETVPQPKPRGGRLVNRRTVGQPAEAVERALSDEGVTVTRAPVRKEGLLAPISEVSSYFRRANPGDEVTLFEEEGKVRYFEVRRAGSVAGAGDSGREAAPRRGKGSGTEGAAVEADTAALAARLSALEAEIAELKKARPAAATRTTRRSKDS